MKDQIASRSHNVYYNVGRRYSGMAIVQCGVGYYTRDYYIRPGEDRCTGAFRSIGPATPEIRAELDGPQAQMHQPDEDSIEAMYAAGQDHARGVTMAKPHKPPDRTPPVWDGISNPWEQFKPLADW